MSKKARSCHLDKENIFIIIFLVWDQKLRFLSRDTPCYLKIFFPSQSTGNNDGNSEKNQVVLSRWSRGKITCNLEFNFEKLRWNITISGAYVEYNDEHLLLSFRSGRDDRSIGWFVQQIFKPSHWESYLFFPARWIIPYLPCFLVEDVVIENCGADEENRMAAQ